MSFDYTIAVTAREQCAQLLKQAPQETANRHRGEPR
jgi:hypothetical protein